MGGVLVFWSEDKNQINDQLFNGFVDSLQHRGPDSRAVFHDPDSNMRLGNRRLAVFDLSPNIGMNFLGNRYWITYNGAIYNFIEVRNELAQLGYEFKTNSDTEVIVASYMEWGEDCLYKFNGVWAFAIWDNQEKKLFIARDRFGVKPLHYFYDGKCLAVASELKSFVKLPNLSIEFDASMIALGIEQRPFDRPKNQTMLKNVYQLDIGHCASFDLKTKTFKTRRWWNTLDHLHEVPKHPKEIEERFRELFLDAVKIRMRADTPMGCLVSGGVDSTSIFCGMDHLLKENNLPERCAPSWNNAYIASYPGTTFDEGALAKEIALHTGANLCAFDINYNSAIDELEKIIYYNEELFEFPIGPWVMYKAMKENGIKVCMDGEGGDDIFIGFHHQVLSLRNSFRRRHPFKYFDLNKIHQEMFEHTAAPKQNLRSKIKDFFSKPEPQKFYSDLLDPINSNIYEGFLKNVHCGMRNWDRLAMSQGVENRAPIRDWRLTCFVFSLGGEWKVGGGYTKTLFRKAMKGLLPDSVRLKKGKLGFANPNHQWGEMGWYKYFLDRVSSARFLENTLWDGRKIKESVDKAYEAKQYAEIPNIAMGFVVADFLVQSFEQERVHEKLAK